VPLPSPAERQVSEIFKASNDITGENLSLPGFDGILKLVDGTEPLKEN
jgi:hypothetical protein